MVKRGASGWLRTGLRERKPTTRPAGPFIAEAPAHGIGVRIFSEL